MPIAFIGASIYRRWIYLFFFVLILLIQFFVLLMGVFFTNESGIIASGITLYLNIWLMSVTLLAFFYTKGKYFIDLERDLNDPQTFMILTINLLRYLWFAEIPLVFQFNGNKIMINISLGSFVFLNIIFMSFRIFDARNDMTDSHPQNGSSKDFSSVSGLIFDVMRGSFGSIVVIAFWNPQTTADIIIFAAAIVYMVVTFILMMIRFCFFTKEEMESPKLLDIIDEIMFFWYLCGVFVASILMDFPELQEGDPGYSKTAEGIGFGSYNISHIIPAIALVELIHFCERFGRLSTFHAQFSDGFKYIFFGKEAVISSGGSSSTANQPPPGSGPIISVQPGTPMPFYTNPSDGSSPQYVGISEIPPQKTTATATTRTKSFNKLVKII